MHAPDRTVTSRRAVSRTIGAAALAAGVGVPGVIGPAARADDGTTALPAWMGHMRATLDPVLPAVFSTPQFTPFTTTESIPTLKGATLVSFWLAPGGIREAHWHPNCVEFPLVLSGEVVIGLTDQQGNSVAFHARAGDALLIPRGWWHWFWNPGPEPMHIINGFTTEAIQSVNLPRWVSSLPDAVLAQALGVAEGDLPHLPRFDNLSFLHGREGAAAEAGAVDAAVLGDLPYSVNLIGSSPLLETPAGSVRMIGAAQLPAAEATWRWVTLAPSALFEPHWHANATEMIYLTAGTIEIGMDAPDGESDRFTASAGDAIFIPLGWGHWVRAIGEEPVAFAVFQTAGTVQVSTLKQALRAIPTELLARSLFLPEDALADLTLADTPVLSLPVD